MLSLLTSFGCLVLAQTTPGAVESASSGASVELESVWDFVVKGGVMMIPIGICSIIAFAVVVERLVTLRRARVIPKSFMPGLTEALGNGDDDAARAMDYCREDGSAVANVFAAGIRRLGGPIDVIERHIQDAGQREAFKLRKYLRVLSLIAAVTPLMGLLGTIFGMISAFQTVAVSGDALGKTELLAEGIYEAMITTAAGLIVAIPVLICYHWLAAKIQKLVMDIDEMSVEFVEALAAGVHGSAGAIGARADARDGAAAPSLVDNETRGVPAAV